MNGTVKTIALILGIVATAFGGYSFIDSTYASKTETVAAFYQFKRDMETNQMYYRLRYLEDLAMNIRWHLSQFPNDRAAAMQLHKVEQEIQVIQKRINDLMYHGG